MNQALLSFLSRKFISAHISIVSVFVVAVMSKYGLSENVSLAAIGAISAICLSYQTGNAIAKKYEGSDGTPK